MRPRRQSFVVEEELSGTLPSHMEGSVPFNVSRLYARL
jgi:hypothetical protein